MLSHWKSRFEYILIPFYRNLFVLYLTSKMIFITLLLSIFHFWSTVMLSCSWSQTAWHKRVIFLIIPGGVQISPFVLLHVGFSSFLVLWEWLSFSPSTLFLVLVLFSSLYVSSCIGARGHDSLWCHLLWWFLQKVSQVNDNKLILWQLFS